MTSGRLAVSATKPVAMMNARAAGGEKFSRSRMATTMGVSSSAAPSLAKNAAMTAPSTTISGNSRCPRPLPQRATCNAAQVKKPASSRISEMMISATKVKVASQTMSHTTPRSDQCTTPATSATSAPARALQPIPSPLGCQITRIKMTTKIANASIESVCSEGVLVNASGYRFGAFDTLRIAVGKVTGASAHQPGELHQFLTDIDDTHIEWRRLHASGCIEFGKRLRYGGLVGDGDHPHPSAEDPQLIDCIEALAPARHFHDGQRLSLGGPNTTQRQGNPVDLRLHDAGHRAMPLRTHPEHAFGPLRQIAQLPDLGMIRLGIIRQGQAGRIERAHVTAIPTQQSGRFLGEQTREGNRAQRAIENEDSGGMPGRIRADQGADIYRLQLLRIDIGQVSGD